MAVTAGRITVSTVPVALNSASGSWTRITITNTSANAADIGAANVAANTGYALAAGASVALHLGPGDIIYGIRSGAADAVLSVLRT